jgi:hypothetical protein
MHHTAECYPTLEGYIDTWGNKANADFWVTPTPWLSNGLDKNIPKLPCAFVLLHDQY